MRAETSCADANGARLPRVRLHCAGVRHMHEADPCTSARAARGRADSTTSWTRAPPSLALDTPFFFESEHGDSPFVVRVVNNCVAFLHRGTHVIERSFVFPDRVIDAVVARFETTAAGHSASASPARSVRSSSRIRQHTGPHLCVLVRSDCVNIYTPTGGVFEAALPFQANRLFALGKSGLLLQRSPPPAQLSSPRGRSRRDDSAESLASALLGDSAQASLRPRFFTLAHPLDEVKPLALGAARSTETPSRSPASSFVSDPALEVVAYIASHALLVCFHATTKRFHVFALTGVPVAVVPRVTPVRVVDAQTWQRHRERAHDVHDRVTIAPDWQATSVWTSPVCRTKRKAVATADRATRSAFIASDVDDSALLGLVDRAAHVLLLKRLDEFRPSADDDASTALEPSETDNDSASVIRCRAAVPLSRALSRGHTCVTAAAASARDGTGDALGTDIVVLQDNGTMHLHRGALPICELVPPDASLQDAHGSRAWAATTEIRSIVATHSGSGDAASVEVCGHDAFALPDTIVRCDHPLQFAFAPLLERVFCVLECVLPASVALPLQAAVVANVQCRQSGAEHDASGTSTGVCDWRVFCDLVECAIDSSRLDDHSMGSSSDDSADTTETSAFDQLCRSTFHGAYSAANALLLSRIDVAPLAVLSGQAATPAATESMSSRLASSLQMHAPTVFAALHLLHEDLQLSVASSEQRQQLALLLLELSARLGLRAFGIYYEQATGRVASTASTAAAASVTRSEPLFPAWRKDCVPDILDWIASHIRLAGREGARAAPLRFPTLSSVTETSAHSVPARTRSPLWRTAAVCRVYELLLAPHESAVAGLDAESPKNDGDDRNASSSAAAPDRLIAASRMELMAFLTQDAVGACLTLEDLPFGVQFPVVEAIRAFRHAPPPFVTDDICAFIGREDLAGVVDARHSSSSEHVASSDQHPFREAPSASAPGGHHSDRHGTTASALEPDDSDDGLDDVVQRSQSLFPHDQRLKEVARLVRSSRPLCLKLEKTADVSDPDYVLQQQARLLLLCKRSMALSVARGMVTLGGFDVHKAQDHAWQLRVPALPLAGRTPPTNAIVTLDVSGYAKELTFWPQFHNGCAAGLRLPARDLSSVVNRYWIKYHRPSVAEHQAKAAARQSAATNAAVAQTPPSPDAIKRSLEEAYAAHAGLLLGLGLRGHLQCLSMADVYNYLSLSNEFVTVAILLGMATTAAHCRQRRISSGMATSPSPRDDDAVAADAVLNEDGGDADDRSRLRPTAKAPLVGSGLELTLERSVSKMLCLHIPSLLPPPFAEFSVPASTQTAALLGLGILYQGSGHRLMTELLLTEIARSPSSAQFVSNNTNSGLSTASFDQLEGYALAAGLALGLVVLGRGYAKSGDPGLADMKLEEKLFQYIAGGAQQFGDASAAGGCLYRGRKWSTFGSGGSALSSLGDRGDAAVSGSSSTSAPGPGRDFKSYTERSGRGSEHVNVGVTACGSALALAFMYLQTDNRSIAAQLAVPDTLILLDAVRPDILLVRTLATNLVLWHSVEPTVAWIEDSQVPAQLLEAYRALERAPHASATRVRSAPTAASIHSDAQSICEAYANVVTGACFSIGLRFAGTADARARVTLRTFVLHFRDLRARAAVAGGRVATASNAVARATERVTIERCLAVCAQALALVDAGTGDVETLTLLRSINLRQRVDAELTYGNHMALSSAIGLLFLGGGRATVARTRDAIAALVIALFPMYAMNTADNKYHLQAFRHLYVLAVDTSRLVETIDVNTGANCSVAVQLELERPRALGCASDAPASAWHTLQSPCLLPELTAIRRIVIASDAFYPVEILMAPLSSTQQQQLQTPVAALPDSSDSSELPSAAAAGQVSSDRSPQRSSTANALRLELLRDRNVILLKRTKQHERSDGLASISQKLQALLHHRAESHHPHHDIADDQGDALLATFASYFMHRNATSARSRSMRSSDGDNGSAAHSMWWRHQCEQVVMRHVQEDASRFLVMYLHALHALFRVRQLQSQLLSSSSMAPSLLGLRSLKLFVAYCESCTNRQQQQQQQLQPSHRDAPEPERRARNEPTDDFVVWLKLQTEHALREVWDQCGVEVETCADVQALVHQAVRAVGSVCESATRDTSECMGDSMRDSSPELDMDAKFVVGTLVRYFAAPGVQIGAIASRLEHWERHQHQRDVDCELFRLEPFLFDEPPPLPQASTACLSESRARAAQDERALWLQLMSFFMVKR